MALDWLAFLRTVLVFAAAIGLGGSVAAVGYRNKLAATLLVTGAICSALLFSVH